jgi:hypothetical protein
MIYRLNKKTLRYENISSKTLTYFFLALILTNTVVSLMTYKVSKSTKFIAQESKIINITKDEPFSEEALVSYIEELNIKFANIVIAQAKLETANFSSRIFKENNNLFGMKVAKIRPTTNKGEQYSHAVFSSWKESVIDYALYQARYLYSLKTEEEYLSYLSQSYAEDKKYVEKLKKIIK